MRPAGDFCGWSTAVHRQPKGDGTPVCQSSMIGILILTLGYQCLGSPGWSSPSDGCTGSRSISALTLQLGCLPRRQPVFPQTLSFSATRRFPPCQQ